MNTQIMEKGITYFSFLLNQTSNFGRSMRNHGFKALIAVSLPLLLLLCSNMAFGAGTDWQITVSRIDPSPQPSGFQMLFRMQLQCSAVSENQSNNAEVRFPAQPYTTFTLPVLHPAIENFYLDGGTNEWVVDMQDVIFAGSSIEFDIIARSDNHVTPNGTTFSIDATIDSDNSDPVSDNASGSWSSTANMGVAKYLQFGPNTDALLDIPVRYYLYPCDPTFVEGEYGHLYLANWTLIDELPTGVVYNNSSGTYNAGANTVTWTDTAPIPNEGCDFEEPTDYWVEVTFPSSYFGASAVPPVIEARNIATFEGYPFGEAVNATNRLFDTDTILHGFSLPNPSGSHTKIASTPYFGQQDITFENDTASFTMYARTDASSSSSYFFKLVDPLPCLDNTPNLSTHYESPELEDPACSNPAFQPTHYVELGLDPQYLSITNVDNFVANNPTLPLRYEDTDGSTGVLNVPYERTLYSNLRYKIYWAEIQSELPVGVGISKLTFDSEDFNVLVGLNSSSNRNAAFMTIRGTVAADNPPTYPMLNQYRLRNYGYFFIKSGTQEDSLGAIQDDVIIFDRAPVLRTHHNISASTGLVNMTADSYGAPFASNDTLVMTNLLPLGYTFGYEGQQYMGFDSKNWYASSIGSDYNSTNFPELDNVSVRNYIDVELIDNYNNTGRQLVRASFLPPPLPNVWDDMTTIRFSFNVNEVPMLYSAAASMEVFPTNPTSAANLLCQSGVFSYPQPSLSSDPNDLDGDGVTVGDAFCRRTATVFPSSTTVNIISNKAVKGDLDSDFRPFPAIGDIAGSGGTADFQINILNLGGISLEDFVVYDILPHINDTGLSETQVANPRGSDFNASFSGIDASTLPAGAVVEYSTSTNPCRNELTTGSTPFPTGCTDDWTTVLPNPASNVRALRFTFPAGDFMEFAPGESIAIEYGVTYPNGVQMGEVAWNNFAYAGTRTDDNTNILPSEAPKVGIAIAQVDLSVSKTVTPSLNLVGDPANYSLRIGHDGNVTPSGEYTLPASTAKNINLTDDFLSQGLVLVPNTVLIKHDITGSEEGTTFDPLTGNIHIPEMGPNDSYTITYKAYSPTETMINSRLEVMSVGTGQEIDSTPGNGVLAEDDHDEAQAEWVTTGISLRVLVEDEPFSGNYIEADASDGFTGNYKSGQPINYRYVVENTGGVALSNVTLEDDLTGVLCDKYIGTLASGAISTIDCTWSFGYDVDTSPYVNTGTVTGEYNSGVSITEVTSSNTASVLVEDCVGSLNVVSIVPTGDCQEPGDGVNLTTTGTAPFSYVWSDMLPDAHWTFETFTGDISGNGNNQNGGNTTTLEYDPDAIEGQYSAKFSGNDYIRYSVDGNFMEVFFDELSFSAWLKPTNLTGNKTIIDEGGGTNGIAMRLNNNTLQGAVRNGGTQFNAGNLTFPNDGQWHHVAMVFDNGKLTIYLDGVAGTTVTATYTRVNNHSGNGGLGYYDGGSGFGGGSGNYYSGLMDDVRISHSAAWTAAQIEDLARNDGDRDELALGNHTVTVTNGAVCPSDTTLSVLIDFDSNFTDGGSIGADQTLCEGGTPAGFTNLGAPSGGNGSGSNYQWQSSTDMTSWNNISGATAATYSSGALSETTYFRRGAFRTGCLEPVYSDTLTVDVIFNITNPGSISGDQTDCGIYDPTIINNSTAASGGTPVTIEYQWQSSTDNSTWNNISSAIAASFDPPTITQTTYFRRGARSNSCTSFLYSNVVVKTVTTNVTNGGSIAGNESNCGVYDPANITEVNAPSGGSGVINYRWEQRVGTGAWTNIGGAIHAEYNPPAISTTTLYRRGVKRSACTAYVYSNTVTKTVTGNGAALITTAPSGTLCEGVSYDFGTSNAGAGTTYSWDFGAFAVPNFASGLGLHSVSFDVPNTATTTEVEIILTVNNSGCPATDTLRLDVRPSIEVTDILPTHPTTCGGSNGSIAMDVEVPSGTNFEVSLDGGASWETAGQENFIGLSAGNYNIHVRYIGSSCEKDYGTVSLSDPNAIVSGIEEDYDEACVSKVIYFTADFDLNVTAYTWNFGTNAIPATATGIGPHAVTYFSTGNKTVSLTASNAGCTQSYNETFTVNDNYTDGGTIDDGLDLCVAFDPPMIQSLSSPTGGSGGTPEYEWEYRTYDANNIWQNWVIIPGSNGATYDPSTITEPIQFRRKARRSACSDYVASNIITFHPAGDPDAQIDNFSSVCPGVPFGDNISTNDVNLLEPEFTLHTPPTNGTVTIVPDGSFVFTPNSQYCGTDFFIYEVCNYGGTCCDTASVKLNLGDDVKPQLTNIPDPITIHCDELLPAPPDVIALENCISVSLDMDEISTQGIDDCSLYDYEITRIWTATDYCANSSTASQVITVKDVTAPNIYRIYDLPNGKKMVGGVMKNVGTRWKTIALPLNFATTPLIFAQITSENDASAVAVQLRNISSSQFEMRIIEEEANDNEHTREDVSWFAVETGSQASDFKFEADLTTANQAWATKNFVQSYTVSGLLAFPQTSFGKDPFTVRSRNLGSTSSQFIIREEQSADTEMTHLTENVGYFTFERGSELKTSAGEDFGETGRVSTDEQWKSVSLNNTYKNPVVITHMSTYGGSDPCVLRVRNVTSNSFEVRVQEWDYLNDIHASESIDYIVMEGSVPFDVTSSCDEVPAPPSLNVEIVAVDNCDVAINLEFTEQPHTNNCAPDNEMIRTWSSTDACGNTTSFSRIITVFDDKAPEFTVPADVTVSCLDDVNDLTLTGDVTDESDNCSSGIEAIYADNFTGVSDCSESFIIDRNWALSDGCGNSTNHVQKIYVQHQGIQFQVKMMLQGAMYGETISPSTLMRDDLRAQGLLPLEEPYTMLEGFAHSNGGGGETVDPAIFDVTGPDAIVDWVFVEIRNDTILDSIMATRSALLQRDGDVVDLDGFSPIVFETMQPNDYHVVIRHRNHLPVMTGSSWYLTDNPTNTSLNFTEPKDMVLAGPGDLYECLDYDADGSVMFCTNPDDPNLSKTRYAKYNRWRGQQRRGAICGPCGDFITVQDGPWNSPSTWKDGNVPANHLTSGGEVVIRHNVSAVNDLSFYNNSVVWIENASLNVTGSFYMEGGRLFTRGADINLSNNFSADSLRTIEMVGTRLNTQGATVLNNCNSYFEKVCMDIEDDFKISSGRSTFFKSYVKINLGGFLSEKTNLSPYIEVRETGFKIKEGNFDNQGEIAGEIIALETTKGKILNSGDWRARILHYCTLDGIYNVSSSNYPSSEECNNIDNYFAGFVCSQIVEQSGTDGTVDDIFFVDLYGVHPAMEEGHTRANWGADLNGDNRSIFQGPNNDVTNIFLEVIGDDNNIQGLANFIRYGYYREDYDMDGKIIYQGPDNDAVKVLFDVILKHPGNIQNLANFIVNGQIPE